MFRVIRLLPMLILFVSCHRTPLKVDVSGIGLTLTIQRLDHDIFTVTPENGQTTIPQLEQKYGPFFKAYNEKVLALGNSSDPLYSNYLNSFLKDSVRISSRHKIDSVFQDILPIQKKIEEGFRHYKYYFPNKKIPQIITIISGFNQSVVMTDDAIGISLDNYLGAGCNYYAMLALPAFKRENMQPAKIPTDVLYAWGVSEYLFDESTNNLISNMVYQGKMLYFLDAMFPDEPDYLKIGYQPEKLEWCKKSEGGMWTYLVEHKLIFNTERMNIVRFINPAPFTSCFTNESPGRTGTWIGWQIVRSYMKNNPKISLPELMTDNDYQKILNESGYSPE
jgi:gliding motility-associated lipoprotein GldB